MKKYLKNSLKLIQLRKTKKVIMSKSFFRYPGGKSKLSIQIINKINKLYSENLEYREPFFGGGSIGLSLINQNKNIKKIWINDFDLGIASLWTALIQNPDALKKLVMEFVPSIEAFDKFKKELTQSTPNDVVDYGFKKLAIHQISYSGLGTKSGGPLGGREQKSNYKIDCRWSPSYICKKIDALNKQFKNLSIRHNSCTDFDFSSLIEDEVHKALIYLDPPYFVKGNDLYQCGFTENDHVRLSNILHKTKHHLVLSYDDCPEVRKLYNWANIEEINDVNYSITALKDKKTGKRISRAKAELLITNV